MPDEIVKCERCGQETQLHVCGIPLCIKCDEERTRLIAKRGDFPINWWEKAAADARQVFPATSVSRRRALGRESEHRFYLGLT
jgi:hypothetical protein